MTNKMEIVYDYIYKDRYNCAENEIEDAKKLITKNIEEFDCKVKDLKNWVILNVGTGREAITFSLLGAQKCYIVDVSPNTEKSIKKHKKNGKFKNVIPITMDICSNEFTLPEKIDFVYLNGVYHHLHSPIKALRNINNYLKVGSRIFYRLYKTGSLQYFISDYVRRFMLFEDKEYFNNAFTRRFGEIPMNKGLSHEDPRVHLFEMCFDNIYVPVLNLFDPNKLYKYYEMCGFSCINKLENTNYHHEVLDKAGTGFSTYFKKEKENEIYNDQENLLKSVDQLLIPYKETFIKKTVEIMKLSINKVKKLSSIEKNLLAIELFYISQIYRIKQYSNSSFSGIDINDVNQLSNSEFIHFRIQKELSKYT